MANYILEYADAVKSGKIVAGKKIQRVIEHLRWKMTNEEDGFFFDEKRGSHILAFFERYLRHSQGRWGGKLIELELWEKALLQAAFGFVDSDGFRQYQRVVLIVAKKNGKSFIASGVGLYLLMADGEAGPQIYSVATTRDQAKIVWTEAKRMRNKAPAIRKRTRSTISEIAFDQMDGIFKPLASNTDRLDGLNIHGVFMDEFHQWKNGRQLYNIMADGITARDQPMIFMTSTAGVVREDIYDEIYEEMERILNGYKDPEGYKDPRTLPFVYELDERSEWTDAKAWIKANPNLGVSKSIQALTEKVERAKHNPSQVKNLLTKEFNIPETSGEAWLSFEDIDDRRTFDLMKMKPRYAIAGVDLSRTTDLTSACILFQTSGDPNLYVHSMFWMPTDLVERRVREDRVPYDKWIDQGWMRVCEGNIINYKDIVSWFEELRNTYDIFVSWFGYDAWSAQYFVEDLRSRYGEYCLEPVRQGKQTLSAPMYALGADLAAHKIIYNNNPILKWCMTNVAIEKDKNGNIQPIKAVRQNRRIDGFAALLDAYVVRDRHLEEYANLIGG